MIKTFYTVRLFNGGKCVRKWKGATKVEVYLNIRGAKFIHRNKSVSVSGTFTIEQEI